VDHQNGNQIDWGSVNKIVIADQTNQRLFDSSTKKKLSVFEQQPAEKEQAERERVMRVNRRKDQLAQERGTFKSEKQEMMEPVAGAPHASGAGQA